MKQDDANFRVDMLLSGPLASPPGKQPTHQRDKQKNTVEFNKKAKKRREKEKHDSKQWKVNQRKKK